jgi:hypothetical protein
MMSTKKKVGGITNFLMVISKVSIAAASLPHKAALARINASMSKMQPQIYLLR